MMPRLFNILAHSLCVCVILTAAEGSNNPGPIELVRDVAIIGGGASGTYAAVRLREDLNMSMVLIEPRPNLGGHTSTYHIPKTNISINFGVQSYLPYGPAKDFFARFGIPTAIPTNQRLTALNVDVETGKILEDYSAPSANATNEAFQRWLSITTKYREILEPGYWDFPSPVDIPADLLTPFGDFAKLNKLEAAVPRIVTISGVGYGGVRDLLTFNVLQAFGASLTNDFLSGTLFKPIDNNGVLYERALELLKPDVLLSSTVQDAMRTANGVELSVKQGDTKYVIKARRVLYTAGPSLDNLAPFHPDEKESAIFSKWIPGAEFVAVLEASCLPENYSITYLPSAAVPADQLAIKDWPYSLRLDSTGPPGQGLFRVIFGANYTVTKDEFTRLVLKSVKDIQNAGTVPSNCNAEFKALSDHSRPSWPQSAEQLRAGFVQDLYDLQGYNDMWYTGYAWGAQYSSTVWAFTDTVLEKMLGDLTDGS